MNWFDVDKKGLAAILERRGKEFVVYELIANAMDTGAKNINVHLTPIAGEPLAELRVEDDDPDGFKDLSSAWTLFAPSERKGDATKRGRFGLGEKLVLALAREASIVSTKGGVRFDAEGRHSMRKRRESGSMFTALLRMTHTETETVAEAVPQIIVPYSVKLSFNDMPLVGRAPLATTSAKLYTDIADDEGNLRRVLRQADISIYDPSNNNGYGWLYELGIPVCETGDRFDVVIDQKVPLNLDRDGVSPAYLRSVRVAVLNRMAGYVSKDDATTPWVRDAVGDTRVSSEAVKRVMDLRFGTKRVVYDPSDVEANRIAASQGMTVIPGSAMSGEEWAQVRRDKAVLPAGQVTPSPKPYSPDGAPLKMLDTNDWTPWLTTVYKYAKLLGEKVLGCDVHVKMADDSGWGFRATYARGTLTLNAHSLRGLDRQGLNELLIHEFAHHFGGHLTHEFDDGMGRIGAAMVELALEPKFTRVFWPEKGGAS